MELKIALLLILTAAILCLACVAQAEEKELPAFTSIRDVLDRFLAALPPDARKIFVRRYWYMSSLKEIAEEYRISEGTAAVSLLRTRRKLKSVLEKEGIHL